jgi:hypothetical protein
MAGKMKGLAASLVLVVGYEGSDPARRALAAAGRLLQGREGWIEIVYVAADEGSPEETSGPAADLLDSLASAPAQFHYEIHSLLDQPWRLRSVSGAVADQLIETARVIAEEGGELRTVAIVVGSDHRMSFSVPIALARRSIFPVVIVP